MNAAYGHCVTLQPLVLVKQKMTDITEGRIIDGIILSSTDVKKMMLSAVRDVGGEQPLSWVHCLHHLVPICIFETEDVFVNNRASSTTSACTDKTLRYIEDTLKIPRTSRHRINII